jgi:hypothetical protein
MDDVDKAPEKLKEFWKDDPVHMTAEGYEELVTAVSKVISTATFNRPAHGRPGKSGGHHAGGRGGSRGGSRKRSQWVCEDDTVAHRRDEESSGGYKKFCGGRDQPIPPGEEAPTEDEAADMEAMDPPVGEDSGGAPREEATGARRNTKL